MTTVASAVGAALARAGVRTVFGLVGSGNFHLTNALTAGGARFIAARHEGGAAVMADAYARVTGELGVLSVHQGPGLTNALTGIAEAAKSRTPLLVLAPIATSPRSNFYLDDAALAAAVGANLVRVSSSATAAADLARAYHTAVAERRTVILSLPLEVQTEAATPFTLDAGDPVPRAETTPEAVSALTDALLAARTPVFLAGRGARGAKAELVKLAERVGALLATSAVARGLFRDAAFNLDVSGGFATPIAADLIQQADLLCGWGCALNMWTLRHGTLVSDGTTVVQVDVDPDALGAYHRVDLGIVGDTAATARAVLRELDRRGAKPVSGYRSEAVAARLAREGRWRDVPYADRAEDGRIDPRTLSIALDRLLPADRTVAVDSGNFMGYPSMFLDVPDAEGFVFTQAFQSVGLGLATAIGAAIARPERLTVAALGDGGALMGIADLETAVRLGLDLLVLVYNDEAYGAEVHHFGPGGHPLDHVTFPAADIAQMATGFGCVGVTIQRSDDLAAVAAWLAGPRDRPMLVDAKVTRGEPSWWLAEAFRNH
jgi:thiamine pyrophosphate-dependent acetolactate synthase large subunit-like protein